MFIEIVTPEKNIYSGDIESVVVPGASGSFGMLKNHAPLISTLTGGKVKIITDEKKELFFEISGGVIETAKNNVVILADSVITEV